MITANQMIVAGVCLFCAGYSMEHHYSLWIIAAWHGGLLGVGLSIFANVWEKKRNKKEKHEHINT